MHNGSDNGPSISGAPHGHGATIPEDDAAEAILSKQPRKNQPRVVVALGIGVLGGELGTVMMLPVVKKSTITPTPRPTLSVLAAMGPLRAPDDDILLEMSDDLMECKKQLKGIKKQLGSCDMQLETCAARACCVCD